MWRERVLHLNIFPNIMVRLSKEQMIFVLTSYFETKSYKTGKQMFLQHFPNVRISVNSTIMRLSNNLKDTGNVANEQWSWREISATTCESMDCVQAMVGQHPHTSSYRIASTFQLMVQILSKHSYVNYVPPCIRDIFLWYHHYTHRHNVTRSSIPW